MMDQINAMKVFRRVIETGSFTAVANEMGITQPTVSKHINSLESYHGTKLMNRSTRQLHPTDTGLMYYERCCLILDELDDIDEQMRAQLSLPAGTLRVNAPVTFGRLQILPRLWKFLKQYPEVKFDMFMDDNYVDLVKEGIDVAIRIGPLTDSTLIARKIGIMHRYTVASPEYIKKHGKPETLQDLLQHNCLVYNLLTTRNDWYFQGKKGMEKIAVHGTFSTNNPDAIRGALLAGLGVAASPDWLVEEDIKQGRLVEIMTDYKPTSLDINAIYPQRRFMPAKVNLFINYLQSELNIESQQN